MRKRKKQVVLCGCIVWVTVEQAEWLERKEREKLAEAWNKNSLD